MKRALAWAVLAVVGPAAVGASVPKAPWEYTFWRCWRDGSVAIATAGVVMWAGGQIDPEPLALTRDSYPR